MYLLVGLGNCGQEYKNTRHNFGFLLIDKIIARHKLILQGKKFKSDFFSGEIQGLKILALKPQTFMNLSGSSVLEALRFHKLDASKDLLVVTDDFALPCGAMRLRAQGGDGGHNGLADITRRLGSDRWPRLRVGIDAPGRISTESYVLGVFTPEQRKQLDPGLDEAAEAVACWATEGLEAAMNRFNRRGVGAPAKEA
jgi:PTH1 family peptidyl-tRNA hydrolase